MKSLFTKVILVSYLLISSLSNSEAQFFAVKAGINYSGIKTGDLFQSDNNSSGSTYERIIGFQAGLIKTFSFSKDFGFQTGCIISSKGVNKTYFSTNGKITNSKSLPIYLEIPLDFKFSGNIGSYRLYGLAGIYYARLIGGKTIQEVSSGGITTRNSFYYNTGKLSTLCRNDLGWNIGLGMELNRYLVEAKYSEGISESQFSHGRNSVFSLSLTYMLCLKNKETFKRDE